MRGVAVGGQLQLLYLGGWVEKTSVVLFEDSVDGIVLGDIDFLISY